MRATFAWSPHDNGHSCCVFPLRDRAIVAILIYTAAGSGAVATLKRGSFYPSGDQRMLHFEEKNGKSREIPVRHDLEQIISLYISAAGLTTEEGHSPLQYGSPEDRPAHQERRDRYRHLPHGEPPLL